MTVPRCGLGLAALDGALYALGGWVGLEIGVTVERFDPDVGAWSKIDKMQTPRFAFGITSYQGEKSVVSPGCDVLRFWVREFPKASTVTEVCTDPRLALSHVVSPLSFFAISYP